MSKLVSVLSLSLAAMAAVACGESAPAKAPEAPAPVVSAPVEAMPAPTASAAVDAGPPALKGSFTAFARAASYGKVDKVGEKDGAFKADGVKDLVFDVDVTGPVAALFIASVDDTGAPTGDFDADTLTGAQVFPAELSRALNEGGYSAGVGVYEGDKLLNEKDGSLPAMADASHKLQLHVSAKTAPKGAVRVYAMLTDKTVVTGPVAAAAEKAPAGTAPKAGKTDGKDAGSTAKKK